MKQLFPSGLTAVKLMQTIFASIFVFLVVLAAGAPPSTALVVGLAVFLALTFAMTRWISNAESPGSGGDKWYRVMFFDLARWLFQASARALGDMVQVFRGGRPDTVPRLG